MKKLDIEEVLEEVLKKMLDAAKVVLKKHWEQAEPYAEQELKSFGENLALIGRLKVDKKISKKQALLYINIQKSSLRIVLLTIEGLGLLAVEEAIKQALEAASTTVNKAIGWKLL